MRYLMKAAVILGMFLLLFNSFPISIGFEFVQTSENNSIVRDRNVAALIEQDPIVVDLEYVMENCPQSGTKEDPFIIENLLIQTNLSCITVENMDSTMVYGNGTTITTFRYLVIRNCEFIGIPKIWPFGDAQRYGYGIWLSEEVHNITITNNRFEDLMIGVYCFDKSNRNVIKSNYFNCSQGIKIGTGSPYNIISDNMFVGGSDPYIEGAVSISNSMNTMIINNTCQDLGSGFDLIHMAMNTVIFNNTVTNSSSNGISVVQSNNVVIANNTCESNYYSGIWIDNESTNCTVANNTLAFNGEGFELLDSSSTGFVLASGTGGGGIYISQSSSGNNILYNDLIYNYRNALDDVPGNNYSYNFWTDYSGIDQDGDSIGDTPYYIEGAGGAIDEFPRMVSWSTLYSKLSTTNYDQITLLVISTGIGAILTLAVVFNLKKRMN